MQKVINDCDMSWSTKDKIKAMCHLLCEYAMENDIINKNYTEYIRLERTGPRKLGIESRVPHCTRHNIRIDAGPGTRSRRGDTASSRQHKL